MRRDIIFITMATKKNSKTETKRIGYHNLGEDCLLAHSDNRKVEVGKTLTVSGGVPRVCSWGLHASPTPAEAIVYHNGPVLTKVEVWGQISSDATKFAGLNRKCLAMHEVTLKEAKGIAKVCGVDSYDIKAAADDVGQLLRDAAGTDAKKFNTQVEALLAGNVKVIQLPFEKPYVTEKDVLSIMVPGQAYTYKQLSTVLDKFTEIEGSDDGNHEPLEDLLYEMADYRTDGFYQLDDYTKNGDTAYIRRPAKK